jgi:Fe2+ transport system protein B
LTELKAEEYPVVKQSLAMSVWVALISAGVYAVLVFIPLILVVLFGKVVYDYLGNALVAYVVYITLGTAVIAFSYYLYRLRR